MSTFAALGVLTNGWAQHLLAVILLGVALFIAWGSGLNRIDLGLSADRVGSGLRWGGGISAAVLGTLAMTAAIPYSRNLFVDDRFANLSGSEAAFEALVRIPLATAAFEELLFRGVLLGLLVHQMNSARSLGVAAALFGLWHVTSSVGLADANAAATDVAGSTLAVVLGTVVATGLAGLALGWLRLRSGSLIAPFMVHTALNSGALTMAWALS